MELKLFIAYNEQTCLYLKYIASMCFCDAEATSATLTA